MENINDVQIFRTYGRLNGHASNQFHCYITEYLDLFKPEIEGIDEHTKAIMKTYMMHPDDIHVKGEFYIALRVPGATRGHIKVKPSQDNNLWEIEEVKLYDSTAIVGRGNIGCYEENVLENLDIFTGKFIDFIGYNPKDIKKKGE